MERVAGISGFWAVHSLGLSCLLRDSLDDATPITKEKEGVQKSGQVSLATNMTARTFCLQL